MAIILHIDSAVATASICLAENEKVLGSEMNTLIKEHSSWLHPSIQNIFRKAGKNIHDTDAVAVTVGPGSYTGLRVGLSAAKGLCFSLGVPLISINSLELIASSVLPSDAEFIVPVIDARRMEVFTAVYARDLRELEPPQAMVVDGQSFSRFLQNGKVLFVGNAAPKLRNVLVNPNALFSEWMPSADDMTLLASARYRSKIFSDLAYTEPLYVKEFYQSRH